MAFRGLALVSSFAVGILTFAACVGDEPGAIDNPADPDPNPDAGGQVGADAGSGSDGSLPGNDAALTDGATAVDGGDAGGDATMFTPQSLPALRLWLDSNRGLAAASAVTNWVDQATLRAAKGDVALGNGTSCVPPQRIDGEIKGNPVVRFNGSSTCLVMGDVFYDRFRDFTKGATIFVVAKPGAASSTDESILDFGATAVSSNEYVSLTRDGDNPNYHVQDQMYGLSVAASRASAFITGQTHAVTTVVQPGAPGAFGNAGSVTFFVDGTATTTSSTPLVYVPSIISRSFSTIGRFVPGNGIPTSTAPGFYRGDIGEIIVYLRTLTAAEQGAVHAYLKAKWL